MLKSIIVALVVGAFATTGLTLAAQAHHKTGHCVPGIFTVGCPLTPQGPQPK